MSKVILGCSLGVILVVKADVTPGIPNPSSALVLLVSVYVIRSSMTRCSGARILWSVIHPQALVSSKGLAALAISIRLLRSSLPPSTS
jgi:hypothetical protein